MTPGDDKSPTAAPVWVAVRNAETPWAYVQGTWAKLLDDLNWIIGDTDRFLTHLGVKETDIIWDWLKPIQKRESARPIALRAEQDDIFGIELEKSISKFHEINGNRYGETPDRYKDLDDHEIDGDDFIRATTIHPAMKAELDIIKAENEASFAFKSLVNDIKQIETLKWSDLMDDKDIDTTAERSPEVMLLINRIRNKKAGDNDNRVIIPGNLDTELPEMFRKMTEAASILKTELKKDDSVRLTVAYKDLFSSNPENVERAADSLEKENDKQKQSQVADLATLVDLMGQMPTPESMKITGQGKTAVGFISQTLVNVWGEREFNRPIAQQSSWWRVQNAKQIMVAGIQSAVGGERAATTLITSIEILNRRFIRSVLDEEKDTTKRHQVLRDQMDKLIRALAIKGPGFYDRRLEKKTETIKKMIPDPRKPGKQILEETRRTVGVRPNIPTGDLWNSAERTIIDKINLREKEIHDHWPSIDVFASPQQWENATDYQIRKTTELTRPFVRELGQRKQIVRTLVAEVRRRTSGGAPGEALPNVNLPTGIKPEEWRQAVQLFQEQEDYNGGRGIGHALKMTFPEFLDAQGKYKEGDVEVVSLKPFKIEI